ncbi:MAG: copper chaperone PCu(A)C [Pseudomonas sp.]|nr:copper chaperone PCu(A)C [Pseudomonas sp.]
MRFTALTASLLALTLGVAVPAYAAQHEHDHQQAISQTKQAALVVESAWSRELPPTAPVGAAFLTVRNHSDQTDRLLRAESAIAEITELHAHLHEGDVMRMVKVDAIDIPAHSDLTLEPGGYHIMLINLHKPLVAGQQLPLSLYFEQAGQVDVTVQIKNSDAGTSVAQPEMDHSEHRHH